MFSNAHYFPVESRLLQGDYADYSANHSQTVLGNKLFSVGIWVSVAGLFVVACVTRATLLDAARATGAPHAVMDETFWVLVIYSAILCLFVRLPTADEQFFLFFFSERQQLTRADHRREHPPRSSPSALSPRRRWEPPCLWSATVRQSFAHSCVFCFFFACFLISRCIAKSRSRS